jgi:hypothetical protein
MQKLKREVALNRYQHTVVFTYAWGSGVGRGGGWGYRVILEGEFAFELRGNLFLVFSWVILLLLCGI